MNKILPSELESKFKGYLINKQKQVDKQIQSIDEDDPVLATPTMILPSELGTDAWEADVHAKMVVLKNNLLGLSSDIKQALLKLQHGTFGRCDKCGRQIETERLEAIPTAAVCVLCLTLTRNLQ